MIPNVAFCGRLSARGVVRVSGAAAERFLQGLVTADVPRIPRRPASHYSALLNGRGRVEYDAVITRDPSADSGFLFDVARSRVPALIQHLMRYRLRAAVTIADASEDWHLWACCGVPAGKAGAASIDAGRDGNGAAVAAPDPRNSDLGLRALVRAHDSAEVRPAAGVVSRLRDAGVEIEELEPDHMHNCYAAWRTALGVPEGDDFADCPLPLEMAIDWLRGVAFDKGCYLGQELTARTHYTGTIRKRITPFIHAVRLDDDPQAAADRLGDMFNRYAAVRDMAGFARAIVRLGTAEGDKVAVRGDKLTVPGKPKPIGTVTSAVGNVGLATLRLEETFGPPRNGEPSTSTPKNRIGIPLTFPDGSVAIPWRPLWWHEDAELSA
jgi:folate-binding protein YgfZ